MSALLIKETPEELRQWLKSEAQFNRRSVNQQVLVCLEWCMRTYGEARARAPFANPSSSMPTTDYLQGRNLAARLSSLETLDDQAATQMKSSVRVIRKAKTREFAYGCFD